eukprot:m.229622 g.229622  ORF g.229622 m.229622 type:complete len:447 (+) comp17789_c0_seq1:88-1428(+)
MASLLKSLGVVLVLASLAASQSVRTQNGSLYFEIGGATLALTGAPPSGASGSSSSSGSTLATQSDLAAAISNTLQQTQPQINNVFGALNSSELRLTTLIQNMVGQERTRTNDVDTNLTASISREASRAIATETLISSAVAGAVTATQMLSQSVATLVANDQLRLNTTLATLAAAFTGQLQTWQALLNPQLSGITSSLSTVNSTLVGQVSTVASGLAAEVSRATILDVQLSTALSQEISRAITVDGILAVNASTLVWAEQARASTVEATLSAAIITERSRILGVQSNLSAALNSEITRASTAEAFVLANSTARLASAMATVPTKRVVWSTNTAGSYTIMNIIDTARWTTGFPGIGVYNCVIRSDNGAHWSGFMFTVSVNFYYCTSTYTPQVGSPHCTYIFNSVAAAASPSGCGGTVFTSWAGTGNGAFTYAPGICSQWITLTCTSLE